MKNTKGIVIGLSVLVITGAIIAGLMLNNNDDSKKEVTPSVYVAEKEKLSKGDFKDGEYFGEAKGYSGNIKVKVVVKDGKMSDIEIVSHTETPEYLAMARKVIDKILENGNLDIDSIAGATISSNAIKKAVAQALEKAIINKDFKLAVKENKVTESSQAPKVAGASSAKQSSIISVGSDQKLKDGVYTGVGVGYNGQIKLNVTIVNGKITNIDIVSHREDEPFFSNAKKVINGLLGVPGKRVDAIGGATYSSNGIISAVNNAIAKAIISSGGTVAQNPSTPVVPNKPEIPKPIDPVNPTEEEIPDDMDEAIKKVYNGKPLADGVFIGYGRGYNPTRGKIQTIVTIKNGEIEKIEIDDKDRNNYPDDLAFQDMAYRGIPFLIGKTGRLNIARMMVYQDKLWDLRAVPKEEMKEISKNKLDKKYSDILSGYENVELRNNSMTMLSGAIKTYVKDKFGGKDMIDSVSGATVSFGGIAEGVDDAVKKSSKAYSSKTDVKAISIKNPADKNIYHLTGTPINLSNLEITITKKDGTTVDVRYPEFANNDIEVIYEATEKKIKNNKVIEGYSEVDVVKAKILHIPSGEYDSLKINIGHYSDDYIVGLNYSLDGHKWFEVDRVRMSAAKEEKY